VDGAHVSDVRAAAPERLAYGRLRYPGRDSQILSQAQDAQTGADGKNREMLGTIPVSRVLVFVAEFGCEDDVGERSDFRFPISDFRFPIYDLRLIISNFRLEIPDPGPIPENRDLTTET